MKNSISRIIGIAIAAFVCAPLVLAQSDRLAGAAGDRYVISAKAGGVNFVTGTVAVARTEGRSGLLLKGDKLQIGDRVSTAESGKAEILLNPGSYLRLGPRSAFEFKTTDLDDLQVRLHSGSAIFEVFATKDFTVTIDTPKTSFTLIDSGIYRVDAEGGGQISVWKGRALIGEDEKAVVKSGREGAFESDEVSIAKFDRGDKDEFETWSKDRAKELSKISGRLQRDNMRSALMRSFMGRQWNMYSSFGLWVYDPFTGMNCFLPFGMGWYSPYGYGFGRNIWYYNLPPRVYYPPTNSTGGGVVPQPVKPGRDGVGPVRQPPFASVQGTSGSTGRDVPSYKPGRSAAPEFIGSDPIRPSGSIGMPSISPSQPAPQQVKPGRP